MAVRRIPAFPDPDMLWLCTVVVVSFCSFRLNKRKEKEKKRKRNRRTEVREQEKWLDEYDEQKMCIL